MSARALGYASTSVEGDVIRIMGKDGRDAAAPVPNAVMSVYAKSTISNKKHLSVRSGSSRGSSDERV